MRKYSTVFCFTQLSIALFLFVSCNQSNTETKSDPIAGTSGASENSQYDGFESQVKWGEHIVTVSGCHDCHTPKKMGEHGPENDYSKALSGHPSAVPPPDVDRKEAEKKGLIVTNTLSAWVGPWGVSFAANLTPDETGLGAWSEEQFIFALRNGKSKGLPGSRSLLPPMPWEMFKEMTDGELKAVFAYLKSIPPVNNVVPAPLPPASVK